MTGLQTIEAIIYVSLVYGSLSPKQRYSLDFEACFRSQAYTLAPSYTLGLFYGSMPFVDEAVLTLKYIIDR